MIITHQGVQSFRIQFGDTVVSYNPISKESSFSSTSFGSDIVLISTDHPDMNGVDQSSRGDKSPFVVAGPGEYEIGGIFIRGFLSKTIYDKEEKINTIYLMNLENMNLCFLGALNSIDSISSETKEALDGIDILFVPIGGGEVLSPSDAYKLGVKLEAKIIIPMHYGKGINEKALKEFLEEAGEEKVKPIDKFTVKNKDLEGKEGEVVVISSGS